MKPAAMKPSIIRQRNTIQLSYDLPYNVFDSKIYPVRSPNGSRIIVCGHEEGLRVIWYGGRSFKAPKPAHASGQVNGSSKSEPMVIDLSDDDTTEPSAPDVAQFEEEEDEVDPAEPYHKIFRQLDIPLGTSATNISVPEVTPSATGSSFDSHAPVIFSHLVVAAACADLSIRLVKLPLAPPPNSSNDPSKWGMQIVKISGSNTHQDLITSISLTDSMETQDSDEEPDGKSRSRSGNRIASKAKNSTGKEWSFLIATTSCTGSGLLLVHRMPVVEENAFSQSSDDLFPFQRQFLRAPLSSCKTAFNTCPSPADRSSSLLITLPDSGCVKVYQLLPRAVHPRGRRGSAATMDSTASSSGSTKSPSIQSGKFLITLYPGCIGPSEQDPLGRRKRPLDAAWVLGGRAILVLLEDGEWGVWDLEAAGPISSSSTQNLVKGQNNVSGIQGGSMTRFAVRGMTSHVPISSTKVTAEKPATSKSSELAPMTPHTRKARSDGLFQSKGNASTSTPCAIKTSHASVCVMENPSSSTRASSKIADESIMFSYGDVNMYLPSLLSFWRAEAGGRGSFDTSSGARPVTLPTLRLGGEHIRSAQQLAIDAKAEGDLFGAARQTPDVVITTEHRLILLVSPLLEAKPQETARIQPLSARIPGTAPSTDNLLLERGELELEGIDRMIEDMKNEANGEPRFGKSVGFDVDEDMDIDIGTPTPKVQGRLRPSRGTPLSRGRLFT